MLEKKSLNLQAIRQTASHVLAAALFETFPKVDLYHSGATDVGFVCECYFPHPVHPDTLPLIEQKMKEIVKETRSIRLLEMVPLSASALLEKEGHEDQSEAVSEIQEKGALVELIEMGAFHQLTTPPLLSNTSEVAAFKLLSLKKLADDRLWIEGAASYSKDDLKKFLKLLASFEENCYQKLGAKRGFWKCWEEGTLWLSKGLEARERLRSLFFSELPLVECAPLSDALLLHFERNCRLIKGDSTKDLRASSSSVQQILFCSQEEMIKTVNFSLHSAHKTLIMLGFDCWVRTTGKRCAWKGAQFPEGARIEELQEGESRIDLMAEDSLMRPVQLASLRGLRGSSEKKDACICEAFIERILVLMLEKNLRTSFF